MIGANGFKRRRQNDFLDGVPSGRNAIDGILNRASDIGVDMASVR